jgi:hypothetical protein
MFPTKFVEKFRTILCSTCFFLWKSYRLWDNVQKHDTAGQATDDDITRRMRFACWISKATDTHREYVILICVSAIMVARKRFDITFVHTLPLLLLSLFKNWRLLQSSKLTFLLLPSSTTSSIAKTWNLLHQNRTKSLTENSESNKISSIAFINMQTFS